MPFNVEMPDGTLIQDVPDGTTKAQIAAKYEAHLSGGQKSPESFAQGIGSELRGIYTGLHRIPQSIVELGLRGADAVGLTDKAYPAVHEMFQADNNSYMGNSPSAKVGDVMGQVAGTLPVGALRVPDLAAKAPALAKVAEGILQGATAAGLTSSASDAPLGAQLALGAAGGAALPVLGAGIKAGAKMVPQLLGNLTTGAGANSVSQAFRAGQTGGDASKAFTSSMRGETPWGAVVDQAKAALGNMRAERNAAYRAGMADISKDATVLSFQPVDEALAKAGSVKTFKGKDLSPKTADVRKEVQSAIDEWKKLDPAEYHTPEGFDALKQQLGDIRDALPFNTPQRVVADHAYNAVRNAIAEQAPAYNKVMGDYSKASDLVSEVQRELSLGPKGNPNTALRKLQSVMRDNVNTSWGNRAKLADTLESSGAETLMPSLAGQALSSPLPRGLAKYGAGADIALALMHNPAALAALPLTSPRVVGEVAHGLGQVSGAANGLFGASRMAPALSKMAPKLSLNPAAGLLAPALAYQ